MNWLTTIWHVVTDSSRWMVWNLFLAILPCVLSVWLFRFAKRRSPIWWAGLLVFVAFLPNAPYVLTDLIHLVNEIWANNSLLTNTLLIIPKYFLFVAIGFEAYVLSLINLGSYLKRQRLGRFVWQAEFVLHALSAIGVYLGRFERLNSWNLVTHPKHVIHSVAENLFDSRPLVLMLIGFVAIWGLYWLSKEITLAVLLRRRYASAMHQLSATGKPDPQIWDDL